MNSKACRQPTVFVQAPGADLEKGQLRVQYIIELAYPAKGGRPITITCLKCGRKQQLAPGEVASGWRDLHHVGNPAKWFGFCPECAEG